MSSATPAGFPNASMGVVEAETLRRLNGRLVGFDAAFDRGVWIRSFLADDRLVPRGGERFWPGADQVEDCRRRGEAAVAAGPRSAATTSSATWTRCGCPTTCRSAATRRR